MGLLYEEFHAEKKSWKIGQSELENTIRFRLIGAGLLKLSSV